MLTNVSRVWTTKCLCMMAFSWAAREAESDSAQLRGETECCLLPKKSHMTDSGDMYQWGWIWTPPVAVREGVGTGCFQGGPLWLQQASVIPTTTPPNPICTPTLRTLFVPLPAGRWRGRLGHCCTQPANGSHAVAPWDWSGSFLRGAHPSTPHPRGLTRDHNTYNDTHRPLSGWAG